MFLIILQYIGDAIRCILSWIESYSVTVMIITALITSSLWFRKYLKQRRAEAFFGFYTQLLLRLKSLREWLEEKKLLEINNIANGNIYALIYVKEKQQEICAGFYEPSNGTFDELKELVSPLKLTLLESENNVYPKGSKRSEWYNCQQTLLGFCEFIEHESRRKNTNIVEVSSENIEYKHTMKCRELIAAMDKIQASIEKENY